MLKVVIILNLLLAGCATKEVMKNSDTVPFKYAAGNHLIKVPVIINESTPTFFIFDTGIGVNLLSKKLCDKFNCKITDSLTDRRMSGQSLTVPMSTVSSLTFGSRTLKDVPVGIWEMKGFLPLNPDFHDVEGFLSLGFFREQAFTMDYKKGEFILEDEESLKVRRSQGQVIPIEIHENGPAITIFMSLKLSDGTLLKVEIDLGGDILTLNEKYMPLLGVDKNSSAVITEKRSDETGHPYIRYFSKISGPIAPAQAPALQQKDLKVMFQKIIYDGLIANDYMKRFTVTYDLAHSQIILAR